ncbi:hypothetical protein [Mesorhizobium sp. M0088]|uniref:hypothetical protein n=1 Tax=Mesorhizobium sp. M0088 TaxID=2956873 RepID=UPI00333CD5AD
MGSPVTAETNEPFAIESRDVALAEMSLEHSKGRGLGAARGLAYIAHVVDMKVDEFAEGFQARCRDFVGVSPRSTWRSISSPSGVRRLGAGRFR